MDTFYYSGVVMKGDAILEIKGTYSSIDIGTAERELTACGIKIVDIRQASSEDIRLEKLKKFKSKMTPSQPVFRPIERELWYVKILRKILG